jgi:hypothetical protein
MRQVSQIELVRELALKLRNTQRNKDEILSTFITAGILDKKRNFTSQYSNLKKL